MAISSRLIAISVLQNAVSAAANGATLDITDASSAALEITGTFTGLVANFEASIDNGVTWHRCALIEVATTPQDRVITGDKPGLFFLEYARPLNLLRARISVQGGVTGSMTVRARASLV